MGMLEANVPRTSMVVTSRPLMVWVSVFSSFAVTPSNCPTQRSTLSWIEPPIPGKWNTVITASASPSPTKYSALRMGEEGVRQWRASGASQRTPPSVGWFWVTALGSAGAGGRSGACSAGSTLGAGEGASGDDSGSSGPRSQPRTRASPMRHRRMNLVCHSTRIPRNARTRDRNDWRSGA